MKGLVRCCALALVACLALASCAPALPPQPTLDELLAETNAAHQAIDNDGLRGRFALRQPVDENGDYVYTSAYYTYPEDTHPYDPDLVLTRQQMEEDVVYLFDALYACYGNYDKMGGQAAFDAAEQAILEECAQYSSLRAEEFQKLLVPHFAFVKDAHFQIQNQAPNPLWYPFFFREVAFYEDDGQYITADGKTVASVDGYDDLSQLFKRSISPEGEIVYYPVLLKDSTTCDETLTVHYTDGSAQTLQCEPYDTAYSFQSIDRDAVPEVRYDNDIPVLQVNTVQSQTASNWYEGFQEGASLLGNAKIGILDLRFNGGGQGEVAVEWLKDYAKTVVPSNSLLFKAFSGVQTSNARDLWISNDNLLVILTSKRTASAAEWLIDAAYNLENVLFVGENTGGAMIGSAAPVQLPNSNLTVKIGSSQNIIPDTNDYFEECRGFYPDLWVPAGEAEELAVKLMENLGAVQAEGEAANPAA